MSVQRKVSALELFQVWRFEKRIERIKRRLARLADEKQEIYHRQAQIEDLELGLNGRLGELESKIEHSGVFDG